jgi:hypothetical protein
MLRAFTPEDLRRARKSWQFNRFVLLHRILAQTSQADAWKADLSEELQALELVAPKISPNPHSVYKQIMPPFLMRTPRASLCGHTVKHTESGDSSWKLLEVYNWPDLIPLVSAVTGWPRVHRIPMRTESGFEINGKVNFYDARELSHLGWHFDKVFNLRGRQIVCVLTLRNDWDTVAAPRPPTLKVLMPGSRRIESAYLGGFSMSLHDPDAVFHRVLPFECPSRYAGQPWKRSVLVMRFTDDPTPVMPLMQTLGKTRYLSRHAVYFARVGDVKWCCISVATVLLLAIVVKTVFFRTYFANKKGGEGVVVVF